jgi:transposase InsO family protein
MRQVVKGYQLSNVKIPDKKSCSSCITGKMQRKSFPLIENRNCIKGKMVMSDLCVPFRTRSTNGCFSFLSVVQVCTRYVAVFPIQDKRPEVIIKHILDSISDVQNATKIRVRWLLSDGGGEFVNRLLASELTKLRTKHLTTIRNCPQTNGIVERLNLTILDRVRTWLVEAGLPVKLWHILV